MRLQIVFTNFFQTRGGEATGLLHSKAAPSMIPAVLPPPPGKASPRSPPAPRFKSEQVSPRRSVCTATQQPTAPTLKVFKVQALTRPCRYQRARSRGAGRRVGGSAAETGALVRAGDHRLLAAAVLARSPLSPRPNNSGRGEGATAPSVVRHPALIPSAGPLAQGRVTVGSRGGGVGLGRGERWSGRRVFCILSVSRPPTKPANSRLQSVPKSVRPPSPTHSPRRSTSVSVMMDTAAPDASTMYTRCRPLVTRVDRTWGLRGGWCGWAWWVSGWRVQGGLVLFVYSCGLGRVGTTCRCTASGRPRATPRLTSSRVLLMLTVQTGAPLKSAA
jgi:hypothetical protein